VNPSLRVLLPVCAGSTGWEQRVPRVLETLADAGVAFELVLVQQGASEEDWEKVELLARCFPQVRVQAQTAAEPAVGPCSAAEREFALSEVEGSPSWSEFERHCRGLSARPGSGEREEADLSGRNYRRRRRRTEPARETLPSYFG